MWLVLCAAALAAPEVSLSASPLPTADGIAAGDGQIYLQPGIGLGGLAAHAGGQVGLTDRLALNAGGGMAGMAGYGDVALRYNVVNREHVHVAPWVGVMGFVVGSDGNRAWGPTAGLALDAGGKAARVDLSVPLLTWNLGSEPTFSEEALVPPFMFGRAGVSFRLAERHRLRVGLDPFVVPTVDWNVDLKRFSFGAGLDLVNFTMPGLHARAAWRF